MASKWSPCKVLECTGTAHHSAKGAREMCNLHWKRWRKYGDPLAGRTPNGVMLSWLQSHVAYDAPDCLWWPFPTAKGGRPSLTVDKKMVSASRYMCELAHGPPPGPDYESAHSCGLGHLGCVSKVHLRWATPSENQMDRLLHGTSNRGERCGTARLSEDDVIQIRGALSALSEQEVAEIYGVHQSTVHRARSKETWSWLNEHQAKAHDGVGA